MIWVAVTGADGSGKSTACAAVVEQLENQLGRGAVAEVSVWDSLDPRRNQVTIPFKSKEEANAYLADLDGFARTLFIFHAMARAVQLAAKSGAKVAVLNGYWYKYAVSEIGYGVAASSVLGAAAGFAVPRRVFCLDVTPETAWERRGAATRYEQGANTQGASHQGAGPQGAQAGTGTQERFLAFQRKLSGVWREIEVQNGPWEHVSSLLPPAEVAKRITREILELIRE